MNWLFRRQYNMAHVVLAMFGYVVLTRYGIFLCVVYVAAASIICGLSEYYLGDRP